MQRKTLRNNSVITILMLLVAGFLFTLTFSSTSTVEAQIEEPTATPSDPIWLGFSTARDAIEEEEGIEAARQGYGCRGPDNCSRC